MIALTNAFESLREIANFQSVMVIELAMILGYLSYIANKLRKIK